MSFYQRCFAGLMALSDHAQEQVYGPHRQRLFAPLQAGTVLEIGPGTGVNLQYVPSGTRWIGVEPNPHMHSYIRDKAAGCDLDIDLRAAPAEAIDLADGSADAALSTLVLCSVTDPEQVLAEIRRTLRPGGHFYFLEHVAAPDGSTLHRVQRSIKPLWRWMADGCHSDRATGRLLERSGFQDLHLERLNIGSRLNPIRPHIFGTARK